ncbi:hypothetical protein ACFBZI_08275 [Moraxella sp. ZJ142]|uniref:hypothetical protein n=1 Tax=Moraxella marmotae TaxID=3344520 RepID=UPI0035D415ED
MKMSKKPLYLTLAIATLCGCASTGHQQPNHPNRLNHSSNSQNAKDALASAAASQLRTSFGYQTDIYVSNAIRDEQLAHASDEQRHASADVMSQCEQTHDDAYVALAKTLIKQGVHAEAVAQSADYQKIHQAYQACITARQSALQAGVEDFNIQEFLDNTQGIDAAEQFDLLYETLQQKQQDDATTLAAAIANFAANHDGNHTALDAKKSQLIYAYLIEPAKLSVIGNYQPLLGKFTALPAVDYQAKNVQIHLNQPLYVDFKKGILYLWADNFALANSNILDKQLGDKWKNRWLAIELNDGSLPDGFAKDLLGFIIDAKKQSFASLPTSAFGWVDADGVLSEPFLQNHLPKSDIERIKNTHRIIKSSPTQADSDYARHLFADILYQNIVAKYPEFMGNYQDNERVIKDGENIIYIINADDASDKKDREQAEQQSAVQAVAVNDRLVMNLLLNVLQSISYGYLSDMQAQADGFGAAAGKYQNQSYYGIDAGRIGWTYQRQYVNNPTLPKDASDLRQAEPLVVDIFTNYTATHKDVFMQLPAGSRLPNADNTVNLVGYGRELFERIKTGNDQSAKRILGLFGVDDEDGMGEFDDIDEFDEEYTPDELEPMGDDLPDLQN